MTLPTFPTDSIYKFLFIGGLFLYVFSVYQSNNKLLEGVRVIHKIDSIANQTNELKIQSKRIGFRTDNLEKSMNKNLNKEQLQALVLELQALSVKTDSLSLLQDGLERKMKLIERFEFTKAENFTQFVIQKWTGMILFILGLIGWIIQQNQQDKMFKLQIELLELEKKKNK